MTPSFKSPLPFIALDCRLPAQICDKDGMPLTDDRGAPWLADLSGGASTVEWVPTVGVLTSWGIPFIERGRDWYRLRVWKRRHGQLGVTGGAGPYDEPAYTDPWADWFDEHIDLRYRMADVEFQIVQTEPYRNGVNFWMDGRRVSA